MSAQKGEWSGNIWLNMSWESKRVNSRGIYCVRTVAPHRTHSVLMVANYNANFVDIRQNRPPSTICKKSKNLERTLFWSAKIKYELFWKTSKETLLSTQTPKTNFRVPVYKGVPLPEWSLRTLGVTCDNVINHPLSGRTTYRCPFSIITKQMW